MYCCIAYMHRQRFGYLTPEIDGIICMYSLMGAAPFISLAIATADINSYLFYIFIFLGEVGVLVFIDIINLFLIAGDVY